jgi:transcriptional regulator with XRE-family HTH domain
MVFNSPLHIANLQRLGAILKCIRLYRHLSASEVARRLGISPSSYEDWERGDARLTFDRIMQFAKITDSDGMAIAAAVPLASPQLALHCADNKLMSIVAAALCKLDQQMGNQLARVPRERVIQSVEKICAELLASMRAQDNFADDWLAENLYAQTDRTSLAAALPRKPKPHRQPSK